MYVPHMYTHIYLRFFVCARNSGVSVLKKIEFYGHYAGAEKQKQAEKANNETQQLKTLVTITS